MESSEREDIIREHNGGGYVSGREKESDTGESP